MLPQQSTSRPRLAAHRRNRGHDRLPPEDGHARGAKAVSPTQPRDRVLPRLDQKQTGTAPVPPARLGQSAMGKLWACLTYNLQQWIRLRALQVASAAG